MITEWKLRSMADTVVLGDGAMRISVEQREHTYVTEAKRNEYLARLAVTSRVADDMFKKHVNGGFFDFDLPRVLTIDFAGSRTARPVVSLGRETGLPTGVEVFVGSWFVPFDNDNEPPVPLIRLKLNGDQESDHMLGFITMVGGKLRASLVVINKGVTVMELDKARDEEYFSSTLVTLLGVIIGGFTPTELGTDWNGLCEKIEQKFISLQD